uniref:F-box protein CPR30-like n=1 Tax=Nicotiana sylvestris TaxID=4096 RepID=A0A1U7Y115_NICSY
MDVNAAMEIHFQEEIIMDILSRLPVRSLLRFNCVSNFCKTIIYEPYFKMKHFNRAKNNQNFLKFLVSQWCPNNDKFNTLYCSSLSSVQQVEDVQEVDWPSNGKPWSCRIYCCYNGLAVIGVRNYPEKTLIFLLGNPSTREPIVLSDPQFLPKKSYTCGLGYDSTSDDYKILEIHPITRSEILALKGGSWRKIDKHPTRVYPVLSDMDSTLAFVHGAFRWLHLIILWFCSVADLGGGRGSPEPLSAENYV